MRDVRVRDVRVREVTAGGGTSGRLSGIVWVSAIASSKLQKVKVLNVLVLEMQVS